jgi:hypothetical protein
MMTIRRDPDELVKRLNAWAAIDIGVEPAQFRSCTRKSVPTKVSEIAGLIHESHGTLLLKTETEDTVDVFDERNFDPTADWTYTAYGDKRDTDPESVATMTFVRAYFASRQVHVASGQGASEPGYEFEFDWIVAIDPQDKIAFSFIRNLED